MVQDSQNGLFATKTKSFISLDSRFVDLKNTEERATLTSECLRITEEQFEFYDNDK